MTGLTMKIYVRHLLDDPDEVEATYKKGVYWEDDEIYLALTESQQVIYDYVVAMEKSHLYQPLVERSTTALTGEQTTDSLPADYGRAKRFTINGRAAKLHMAGVAEVFSEVAWEGGMIIGTDLVIRSAGTGEGTLIYVKAPTAFTAGNSGTERAEFDDIVYYAIMYHATATLCMKDENNPRHTKLMNDAVALLVKEPGSMPMPRGSDYIP